MATYSNTVTGGGVVDINASVGTTTTAVPSLTTSANEFKKVYLYMQTTSASPSGSIMTLRITNGSSFGLASLNSIGSGVVSAIGPVGGGSSNNRIDGGLLEFDIPPNTTVDIVTTFAQIIFLRGTFLTYSI